MTDKIYADAPLITQEETSLLALSPALRSKEKVKRINSVFPPPFEIDELGVKIKIKKSSSQVINGGDCVEVFIEVMKDGVKMNNIDGHLRFFNPPLKIPNGTFRTELVNGVISEVHNMEYNPREAIKEIITQQIKRQLNNINSK